MKSKRPGTIDINKCSGLVASALTNAGVLRPVL